MAAARTPKRKTGRDRAGAVAADQMTRESYLNFRGNGMRYRIQYPAEDEALRTGSCIFSYDAGDGSKEKGFVVTGALDMWKRVKCAPGWERNYYEMLFTHRESDLYLDIEHFPLTNSDSEFDFDTRMRYIRELLATMLDRLYNLKIKRIIELDSSNELKNSRHLIVKIAGHRFANPAHCGAFMRRVALETFEMFPGGKVNNPFYQWPEKQVERVNPAETMIPVFDLGVYTQMRSIRLLYNTKKTGDRSKCRFLVYMGEEKITAATNFQIPVAQMTDKHFLDTLIQLPSKKPVQLIEVTERDNTRARWTSEDPVSKLLRSSLGHVPRFSGSSSSNTETRSNTTTTSRGTEREFTRNGVNMYRDKDGMQYRVEAGTLVPILSNNTKFKKDQLIEAGSFNMFCFEFGDYIADQLGTGVYAYYPNRDNMSATFQLKTKDCPIAEREHSSNHIRVSVLFNPPRLDGDDSVGPVTPIMFYRCYNAACASRKQKPVPVPGMNDEWQQRIDRLVVEWQALNTMSCAELFGALREFV